MSLIDQFYPEEDDKKKKASQIAAEQQKAKSSLLDRYYPVKEEKTEIDKVEEKKPSIMDRIKLGFSKIGESLSGKKKIEEQLKSQETNRTAIDLEKTSTQPIENKIVKENIFDSQINYINTADMSAELSVTGKQKAQDKIKPIIDEVSRLETKSKSTETKDWRDRVYEMSTTGKDIPFAGDVVEIPETIGLLQAAGRLKEGKATQEDAKLLSEWLEQQQRDTTFGYKVLNTVIGSAKFGAELYFTAGTYTAGKEAAKKGMKYLMSKAGKEAVEESLEKFGYKVAAGIAGETIRTAALAPLKLPQDVLERQLVSSLQEVSGDIDEKETIGKSTAKAFLDQWTETVSERAGDAFGMVAKPLQDKLLKYSLFKTLNKLNPGKESAITKLLAKSGYDGVLSEMGEERIGEAFRGLLFEVGLSDQEFKLPTMDQLAVESVSFLIPGVVSKTSDYISTKLKDTTINTIQLTPDAAIETVQMSDLRGTDAGNTIIANAYKAKEEGKMVLIDLDKKNGNIVVTPKQNEIGVSISEEQVLEPVKTGTETSLEALETKKKELMNKVSVGTQGETIKTEKTTEITQLSENEIKELKEIAQASTNAKFFSDKIGKDRVEALKASGESVVGFFNQATKEYKEDVEILRGTKGMTADDIMATYPNIQLKKDIPAKDIYGNKVEIPMGEKLTPYELKGNKILLQDGETYIVTKNQFQNIKGQSVVAEGKPFAPELEGTEETTKGSSYDSEVYNKYVRELKAKYDPTGRLNMSMLYDQLPQVEKEKFDQMKNDQDKERDSSVKYSQYTLPGGENYREILIKTPQRENQPYKLIQEGGATLREFKNREEAFNYYKQLPDDQKIGRSIIPVKDIKDFQSSHWEEPNVIAHLRINDRKYNGNKVTFMEELQSDWAREGRDKGFIDPQKAVDADNYEKELRSKYNLTKDEYIVNNEKVPREEQLKLSGMNIAKTSGVPSNPLLKKWQELSIKRALQEAIKTKAKYFAWINGEQTSNRYNLSTQIENINWEKYDISEGENLPDKRIYITPKSGSNNITVSINSNGIVESSSMSEWKGKKLDEVIGKGLADKIMTDNEGRLSGEGLKFGGEWANNLYDKQVKDIVEDLTGEKVEIIDMELPVESNEPIWIMDSGSDVGGRLSKSDLKVGLEISDYGNATYIITDVLDKGKFKVISKRQLDEYIGERKISYNSAIKLGNEEKLNELKQTFDITVKKSEGQQSIKITPEVEARVKGEAPKIETSGKKFEEKQLPKQEAKPMPEGKAPVDKFSKGVPPIKKKTVSQKVRTAKNITQVKSALKGVRKNIEQLIIEAEGKALVAQELREGLNTKDIAKLKRIYWGSEDFQAGDIETIRSSKWQKLLGNVIEDVQAKRPDLSEQEAFDYAMELPTKAEEGFIKTEDLKKLIERRKTLEGYISTLENKIKELTGQEEIKRENEVYQEWKDALDTQEKLNTIITAQQRLDAVNKPVSDTTGEDKLSKAAERVLNKLIDIQQSDITYQPMNIVQDAARASEFVDQSPEMALKIAKGLELPPPDITETAISIAMAEKARQDGDYLLYSKLVVSRSLRQTRRGQEIVAEKGRQDENSSEFFMKKLLDERARLVAKGKKWMLEKGVKIRDVKIQNVIEGEVKKLKNTIDGKVLKKLESAQKLIDSLTCKI